MICYEVLVGQTVRRGTKSAEYYSSKMSVNITRKQYIALRRYLDAQVVNKVRFNKMAFIWNFFPITNLFPMKGDGAYCAQLIGDGLVHAGIITLKGHVNSDGYINKCLFCCCFCPPNYHKEVKYVKIPYSYQLTPKLLWDIIKDQNPNDYTICSSNVNVNMYSPEYSDRRILSVKQGDDVVKINFG